MSHSADHPAPRRATLSRIFWFVVIFAIVLFWVSQCGKSSVPWNDYSSDVRTRIDSAAAARDCSALQSEFDTADASNTATMNRTGHNNAALLEYIGGKMKDAGCYTR